MHRVIFPDGRKTKPMEVGDIRQLFAEEKIPANAVVEQLVPIIDFVSPDLLATEKQKEFASNLGIQFHPMIGRRALSKLIDEALDARDEHRLNQMYKVGAGDQAARAFLVAEMEAEGHIWLCNATTDHIIDELEGRDIASVLVVMEPDDVSTLVAVQEEKMTEELATELKGVSPRIAFTCHIEHHELRKVLLSVILGLPEERKPRKNRRLHE